MARLSVVVPAVAANPALVDRAVASVLKQADPIGTEVIVAGGDAALESLLRARFPREVGTGALRFVAATGASNARNAGALAAGGNFIGFLEPRDSWLYGRLIELWPLLEEHDFIFSPREEHVLESDWLRESLRSHRGSVSSWVLRKSLFEAAGGLAGDEYYFLLRVLSLLERSGRRRRLLALPAHNIQLGQAESRPRRREAVAILRAIPALPRRYWPEAVRSSCSRFFTRA